jgi:hypothetical protein
MMCVDNGNLTTINAHVQDKFTATILNAVPARNNSRQIEIQNKKQKQKHHQNCAHDMHTQRQGTKVECVTHTTLSLSHYAATNTESPPGISEPTVYLVRLTLVSL